MKKVEGVNPMKEIVKISGSLPLEVLQDIHQRTSDWLAGGGRIDDDYIFQQLRYARNVVKMKGVEKQ